MKVRELIEILTQLDQDKTILCTESQMGEPETSHVSYVDDDLETLQIYDGYVIVGGDSLA